jgi:hypothetical protein
MKLGETKTPAAMPRPSISCRWRGVLVTGLFSAAAALSAGQPQAQTIAPDDAPVLAADSALGEAVRAGDKAVARRLLALQFSFIDAEGTSHARREFLSDLKGAGFAPSNDAKVRIYGLLAIVTGHRTSHDTEVFFLDIWAKQKGAWRALLIQEVSPALADAATATVDARTSDPPQTECRNPCQIIPYRVRSPAEQEIVTTFQEIEKAVVTHDAAEWSKHVADEFVRYRSSQAPVTKAERIAAIERQKETNATAAVGEVQAMRLAVYGDGAAMVAAHAVPDDARAPYRATRVWVRRNGQWQMVISVQTDVK